MTLAVGTFATSAIEPLFEDRSVLGEGVFEGAFECLVVRRGAIRGSIAIPRRDIYAELEIGLAAGIGEVAKDISLPILPMALFYGVVAGGIGPEAETVVMFGGDDDAAEAGGTSHSSPLVAVEVRGVEDIFGLGAGSPFSPRESVGTEMTEHIHLHALPTYLSFGRTRAERGWGAGLGECRERKSYG